MTVLLATAQLYHDFSNVDLKDKKFVGPNAYRDALVSFRNAVLRRGRHTRLLHTHRRYTNLPGRVPEAERTKYSTIVTMSEDGTCTLTAKFEQAIKDATEAADTHGQANGVGPP